MAEPQQVAVVDGATLRLLDTVVRLNGVAAPAPGTPERDRGARPGTAPTADHGV